MKWLLILGVPLILSGCAAAPRCDGHLTPINPAREARAPGVVPATPPIVRPPASRTPRVGGRP